MPIVIFVTAFDHYAVEAFKRAAFNYLPKPVEPARLRAAIARARKALTTRGIHSCGRSYLIRQALGCLEARFDPAVFQRIHRSSLVRLDRIVRLRAVGAKSSVVLSQALSCRSQGAAWRS